jgi:hypothetical protein
MTINVPVWVELVCCTCATTSEGMHSWHPHRNTTEELVESARRARWVFAHAEAFCSDSCLEAYRKKVHADDISPILGASI